MKFAVILSGCVLGTAAVSAEPGCVKTAKLKVGGVHRLLGTVRMGAWILETASSDEPELRLTFRILSNDLLIVRQIISLKQVNGRWKAMDVGTESFHRLQ
ncbi:MAG TPA: hypothetical protein VE078_15945 [Thermoanaerobaculia bacterium]|nr:hypothetical protein [Thermoanaerobaculia bacterium]